MENKSTDRRVQRTRRLLLDALVAQILEKGYESVTVQDIIDHANVGRSTFYAHFQDKEDLLLSGFEILRGEFEKHLMGEGNNIEDPWGFSLIIFRHIQVNPKLFKIMVGKQGNAMILQRFIKYLTMMVNSHIKTELPLKARELIPPEVLSLYIIGSLTALLTWWVDNDIPYTAERMNEMYQQLTQPGVEALFKMN
jgi:AcrR family transcriptional regulator